MKNMMHAAIAAVVLTTSGTVLAQPEEVSPTNLPGRVNAFAPKAPAMEKCYGVVKAHMNDCASTANACAGQSGFDGAKTAWIYLPKGSCEKLVNGTTKTPDQTPDVPTTNKSDTTQ